MLHWLVIWEIYISLNRWYYALTDHLYSYSWENQTWCCHWSAKISTRFFLLLLISPIYFTDISIFLQVFKCINGLMTWSENLFTPFQDGESGWSSLHRGLHFGHLAVACVLLQFGASSTLEDTKSRTPVDLLSGPVLQTVGKDNNSSMLLCYEIWNFCFVSGII